METFLNKISLSAPVTESEIGPVIPGGPKKVLESFLN